MRRAAGCAVARRPAGAQLRLADHRKRQRLTACLSKRRRPLSAGHRRRPRQIVGDAVVAIARQRARACGGDVVAADIGDPVLGKAGQHASRGRHLRFLRQCLVEVVHAQDRPRPGVAAHQPVLARPIGSAHRRLRLVPRAAGRQQEDVADTGGHGRVDRRDHLRAAHARPQVSAGDQQQPVQPGVGARQGFRPVIVAVACFHRRSHGLGRAGDCDDIVAQCTTL